MMATLEPAWPKNNPTTIKLTARSDNCNREANRFEEFLVSNVRPTPANTTNSADDTPVRLRYAQEGQPAPVSSAISSGKIWVASMPQIAARRAVSIPVRRPGASRRLIQCHFQVGLDQLKRSLCDLWCCLPWSQVGL